MSQQFTITSSEGKDTMKAISNLPQLATTANDAHQQFERLAGEALDHAQRAGQALTEAKAALPHGQFETWIEHNVKFSARTARSYMRVATNWQTISSRRADCPSLSLRDAIQMLATPQDTSLQIGNALPFCVPSAGEMLLGLLGEDCVVIESHDQVVRIAFMSDGAVEFMRRGARRDCLPLMLKVMGIDPSQYDWLQPRPATAQNNPLSDVLPEWRYAA